MKALIFIVIGLLVAGCGQSKKTRFIDEIIAGGLSERDAILQGDSSFSDYKVYRDGNNDGVCYEYIFKVNLPEDENNRFPSSIRGELINVLKSDGTTKNVMGKGIYFRFIYKNPDGRVIADQKISSLDF